MGSACVFFDSAPTSAVLSDFNSELVQFFTTLQEAPNDLYKAFSGWNSGGDDYYVVRSLRAPDLDAATRAGRFLYLNRFAFNGVYRTNRKGDFNVPRGVRTGEPPTEGDLVAVAKRLKDATILCADYLATTSGAKKGDFVYLDPPYRNDARSTYGEYGYGSFGAESDIHALSAELERLTQLGAHVMLSFNDDLGLEQALEGWDVSRVSRRRNVAGAASARTNLRGEILATNYGRQLTDA